MSEEEAIKLLKYKIINADTDIYIGDLDKTNIEAIKIVLSKNKKQKEVLDKIDKLINTDYGWVSYYYKYNNRYLKSEIKEDINKLLEEIE